jgi:hypothetical protein
MQDQVDLEHGLSDWLRQVADADAAGGASPAVRERLLQEVRASAPCASGFGDQDVRVGGWTRDCHGAAGVAADHATLD